MLFFDKENFFKRLTKEEITKLSKKNLELLDKNWKESSIKDYKNVVYLDVRNLDSEYLAYHVGVKNQNWLTAIRYHIESYEFSLKHVFFSTNKGELEHYLDETIDSFTKNYMNKEEMVYFVNLKEVKEGKIQVNNTQKAIWQNEIIKTMDVYKKGLKSRNNLKEALDNWIQKYTINFNPNEQKQIDRIQNYSSKFFR